MNYGKEHLEKRKKDISSKKNMQKKRVGVRFFKALIVCVLLLAVVGVGGVGYFAKKIIDDTPTVTPAQVKPSGFTTFVYAKDGTLLEEFLQSGSNRIYKTIDEIPDYMGKAFVAIEDERFFQHNGIDLQGIIRAGVKGITSGSFDEGASTLTQQLIKNNIFKDFMNESTFYDRLQRKLQEQFLAIEIEKQMTKDEILEAYMNTINLGQNCLGVQSAANRYFGKDVSELTISECAVIAGITQSPSGYDPVVHPEANQSRREDVLDHMLEQNYITQAEYDEAVADPVYERILPNAPFENTTPYTYFNDEIFAQIMQDLKERKGYTDAQASNAVLSGGLSITSTQDMRIQAICDEEVANEAVYPAGTEYGLDYALTIHRADGTTVENYSKEMLRDYIKEAWGREYALDFTSPEEAEQAIAEYKSTLGITEGDIVDEWRDITAQPQTSVVVMDQHTGEVLAITGGRGQKMASLSLNRATDSTRQPGSCFKVLSTYAPAIDAAGYTLATAIPDEKPFEYPNDPDGKKANNWDGIYTGSATVRKAIWHSMNVCALNTLQAITPQLGYDYLINFGFTTIVNFDDPDPEYASYTDVQLPTALGGITHGVTNLELTAAYAAIANAGTYTKPILYTQVLDHDGNVLLDNEVKDTHPVVKDSTAALLTSAMQDVINIGTGTSARMYNMPVAGKTGTSEFSRDLWLAAYTPYYTASVWGGYDSAKPMENIYDQVWHEVLWKNIMERVHEGVPRQEFTMPPTVQQKTVCQQTGFLATTTCQAITEYFAEGSVPSVSCSGHYVYKPPTDDKKEDDKTDGDQDGTTSGGTTTGGTTTGGTTTGGTTTGGTTTGGTTTGGTTTITPPDGTGTTTIP